MLFFLLAQQDTAPSGGAMFAEYGILGAISAAMFVALRMLWTRIDRQLDEERQRGDRLEAQLSEVNKFISQELSGLLVRATLAMRDVTEAVQQRDRDRSDK